MYATVQKYFLICFQLPTFLLRDCTILHCTLSLSNNEKGKRERGKLEGKREGENWTWEMRKCKHGKWKMGNGNDQERVYCGEKVVLLLLCTCTLYRQTFIMNIERSFLLCRMENSTGIKRHKVIVQFQKNTLYPAPPPNPFSPNRESLGILTGKKEDSGLSGIWQNRVSK